MLHGVAANDENVGLLLHATVVRVAEHHVDAVQQLHLDLAAIGTECPAVGLLVRVEPEVRAIVADHRAVIESVPNAVIELELFQQRLHLGIGEGRRVVVGVCKIAAVVVGQRLKAKRRAARCQRGDEQTRHALEDVEGRLRQAKHGGGIRETEPLVASKKLRVGLHEVILIWSQRLVIIASELIELPRAGHIILFCPHALSLPPSSYFSSAFTP